MPSYAKLFKDISDLHSRQFSPDYIDCGDHPFPFKQMYTGQRDVLDRMNGFEKSIALTSPTGAGKTAIALSLSRRVPTVYISPRKFLQLQVQNYWKDFVLFGRSEYPCNFAVNAGRGPCLRKESCAGTSFHDTCKIATGTCLGKPCRVFPAERTYHRYPCKGCQYLEAISEAIRVLEKGGTVICNFGNFWKLLDLAELVVIDEADLFFREIAKPTRLYYSNPKEHKDNEIRALLARERQGLNNALKTSTAQEAYRIQNAIYNVDFLIAHQDLCFKYQRKDKIYVEISPTNVGVLKDKIFGDKRLLIVSATLGEFDIPKYDYHVEQRRGIFYCPVGTMTSTNLKRSPWLMGVAAKTISEISAFAEGIYDTHKFVVHCGNIGTHATALFDLLGNNEDLDPNGNTLSPRRNSTCVLHEKGNIMRTIGSFEKMDKRYLLVASAEYGADFWWNKVQYILKFPYAAMDERMRTVERTLGKVAFNKYYLGDARTRFIQQCGRNVRGLGDFGITVVLDSKFYEDYRANTNLYPEWFRDGFNQVIY